MFIDIEQVDGPTRETSAAQLLVLTHERDAYQQLAEEIRRRFGRFRRDVIDLIMEKARVHDEKCGSLFKPAPAQCYCSASKFKELATEIDRML